jgi:ankyrin repeat protein
MDPVLYKAVTQGNLELLTHILTANPKTLLSTTPQRNTALHIAARLGRHQIAERILNECEMIILEKNIDGDTPMHIASKFGKNEVMDVLINYYLLWPTDIYSEEGGPLTQRNRLGNTTT